MLAAPYRVFSLRLFYLNFTIIVQITVGLSAFLGRKLRQRIYINALDHTSSR